MVNKYVDAGLSVYIEEHFTSHNSPPTRTRLVGIVVIPIWLCFGFFTLGVLWPPQVRERIFCPKIGSSSDSVDHEIDEGDNGSVEMMKKLDEKLEMLLKGQHISESASNKSSPSSKSENKLSTSSVKGIIDELQGKVNEQSSQSMEVLQAINSISDDICYFQESIKSAVAKNSDSSSNGMSARSEYQNKFSLRGKLAEFEGDLAHMKNDIADLKGLFEDMQSNISVLVEGVNALVKDETQKKSSLRNIFK